MIDLNAIKRLLFTLIFKPLNEAFPNVDRTDGTVIPGPEVYIRNVEFLHYIPRNNRMTGIKATVEITIMFDDYEVLE